jgi:hypothetical protein
MEAIRLILEEQYYLRIQKVDEEHAIVIKNKNKKIMEFEKFVYKNIEADIDKDVESNLNDNISVKKRREKSRESRRGRNKG